MKVRKIYIFSGRVQGVGFRFRAYQKATALGITGYVKNLTSGRVEAVFQGKEFLIDEVIKELKNARYIYIASMKVEYLDTIESESSFNIKH